MSTEENKAIILHWFDEFNKGTMPVKGEFFATAFPDQHVTIEDLIAEGDKVVARVTWRGTHERQWGSIPPTGKQMMFTATHIYRIAEGKIMETWLNSDILAAEGQLGATITPESPEAEYDLIRDLIPFIPLPGVPPVTPSTLACVCPYGDYAWFQQNVSDSPPLCPTHKIALKC